MPTDIKSVIAKVKALRELATKNTNTNEMHSAMRAADALMQQHRLTVAEIEASGDVQAEPFVEKRIHDAGKRSAWRETVIWALCQHYGGAWYWGSLGRNAFNKGSVSYIVVAKESDGEIIDYMFNYLEGEISRLCKENTKGQGLATAMSWLLGAAEGVAAQFREIEQAEKLEREQFAKLEGNTNQSTALVLLANRQLEARNHMEAKHGWSNRSKEEKSRAKKMIGSIGNTRDYDARREGYEAGKSIQLNKGLGDGKKGGGLLGQ